MKFGMGAKDLYAHHTRFAEVSVIFAGVGFVAGQESYVVLIEERQSDIGFRFFR